MKCGVTLAFKKLFLVYFTYTGSFCQAALMEVDSSEHTVQEHGQKMKPETDHASETVSKHNVPNSKCYEERLLDGQG